MENSAEQSPEKVEEEVGRVVEQAKELQDSASTHILRTFSDENSLRQRALSLESSIRRLRSLLDSLLSSKLINPKLDDDLQRATCLLRIELHYCSFFSQLLY